MSTSKSAEARVEVDGAVEAESGWATEPEANEGRSERKWSGGSIMPCCCLLEDMLLSEGGFGGWKAEGKQEEAGRHARSAPEPHPGVRAPGTCRTQNPRVFLT